MFGRNNSRETTEISKPTVVIPTRGTGPMMLLRTLGLDPEQLFQTFQGLEQVLRAAVGEVLERSRVMGERMESSAQAQIVTLSKLDLIEARMTALDAQNAENSANIKILLESLAELHRRQLASFPEPGAKGKAKR